MAPSPSETRAWSLTVSLCMAGHYFSHQAFSVLCHVFSQLVFLYVFLYVVLHLFFGRPLLLLPETSSLGDFAQMWLYSGLKQWPNPGKFHRFYVRLLDVLISDVLQPGYLVFPLAHLNILILAEFGLLLFYGPTFRTVCHCWSDDCFEDFVFQFLSHITPDNSFHYIHPILILLLTSACLTIWQADCFNQAD